MMRLFDELPPLTRAAIAGSLSGDHALVLASAKYFHMGYPDAAIANAVTIADAELFERQEAEFR